jgi:hypothetical protein
MTAECPICYEWKHCETVTCGHSLCEDCLYEWLEYSDKCPMCRTVIDVRRDNFEIALVNEHDAELISVIYPRIDCLISPYLCTEQQFNMEMDPDALVRRFNDRWKRIPSTTQFVDASRDMYFMFYIREKVSSKWYVRDFPEYVQERLASHSQTHHVLSEMERVLSETHVLCL